MIAPMKKATILIYHKVRDSFLDKLQDNGLMQIIEKNDDVESEQLNACQDMLNRIQKSSHALKEVTGGFTGSAKRADDIEELLGRVEELFSRNEKIVQRISMYEKLKLVQQPWGDYDSALFKQLREAGINPRFFVAPASKYQGLDFTGIHNVVVNRTETDVYFVVFEKDDPVAVDCEEVMLPEQNLAFTELAIGENIKLLDRTRKELEDFGAYTAYLDEQEALYKGKVDYETTLLNLSEEAKGTVRVLQGWVPAERSMELENFLLRNKVAYYLEDPAADDDIPVLLKNKKFPKLLEPITNLFALPDYAELDPTPFFAPFFIFFYGMCLGDVGYGALVLFAALAALFKGPEKLKGIFILGVLLGAMTMINGLFLNSFFGKEIFSVAGVSGIFSGGASIGFLGSVVTDGQKRFPAIPFSILVGVLQVMLGMALNGVNRVRSRGWLHAIEPLSKIPITVAILILLAKANFLDLGIFTINALAIGPFLAGMPSSVIIGLLVVGGGALVFFNNVDSRLFIRPLRFLWEAYNYGSGLVADGLSYLRLFALGLAGSLLGYAFNSIAFMIVTDQNGVIHWLSPAILATVGILLLGHLLNFALSALGAYVHSVRLIFVEFYGNLSFTGGGKPFKPFSKKKYLN